MNRTEECVIDRERTPHELTEQIRQIVAEEDRAEVVILACAGLCGYDTELSRLSGVPVLDLVAVAVNLPKASSASRIRRSGGSPRHPSRSTATCESRMRERKILAALSPEDLALPPSS